MQDWSCLDMPFAAHLDNCERMAALSGYNVGPNAYRCDRAPWENDRLANEQAQRNLEEKGMG